MIHLLGKPPQLRRFESRKPKLPEFALFECAWYAPAARLIAQSTFGHPKTLCRGMKTQRAAFTCDLQIHTSFPCGNPLLAS
jgi:hypothetical protein